MWHLDKPSKLVLDEYEARLLPALKSRISSSTDLTMQQKNVLLPPLANGSLDESELKGLLTDEPDDLFARSERLIKQLIVGYTISELPDYSKVKKAKKLTGAQSTLKAKYSLLGILETSFGYTAAMGGNKYRSYMLTAAAMHNTCVYCNRQYAFNIERDGGKNDDNRIARPALDHWFPKSLFPLMSLSYYNLIPSCTICNSSAKMDEIWQLSTHIHPYLTAPDVPKFKFRYKPGLNATWNIDFENLVGKEKDTVKSLCLQEAYQAHSELEVADLIEMATKNNGTYLKQLYGSILRLYTAGGDRAKAYRLLLGTEMMKDEFKNRPLSKLKRDIIEQIEKAQGVKFFE